jgi:hypothetical protein
MAKQATAGKALQQLIQASEALDTADLDKLAGITATAAEINGVAGGITATAAEVNNVADVDGRVQTLVASGPVTAGKMAVQLSHISGAIAATIANTTAHQGLFIVKNTSASGTAAHTLTITTGTFNGTHKVATLDAPNEALVVWFDSAGNGTVIENIGTVGLA